MGIEYHPADPDFVHLPRGWAVVASENHPNRFRRGAPAIIVGHAAPAVSVFSEELLAEKFIAAMGLDGYEPVELPDLETQADFAEAAAFMGVALVAYDHPGPMRADQNVRRVDFEEVRSFIAQCRRRYAAGER